MSHKVLTLALLWISNSDLMAPGPIYTLRQLVRFNCQCWDSPIPLHIQTRKLIRNFMLISDIIFLFLALIHQTNHNKHKQC